MSPARRLSFAALTLLILFGLAELASRLIWNAIEARALGVRDGKGAAMLASNAINFMMRSDGVYGYSLRPGLYSPAGTQPRVFVNADGFGQNELVPVERAPNSLRLAAMGESTTHGHNVESGNYPIHLRDLVQRLASGGRTVEMLNAGVSGWVSDQVALRAERQVARYRPDLVVLYVGWNDFQSYDPFRDAPQHSWFETAYGNPFRIESDFPVKLPVLAIAAFQYAQSRIGSVLGAAPTLTSTRTGEYHATPPENYRFLTKSLDRILAAYRANGPGTTIALSTVVGRWPLETRA